MNRRGFLSTVAALFGLKLSKPAQKGFLGVGNMEDGAKLFHKPIEECACYVWTTTAKIDSAQDFEEAMEDFDAGRVIELTGDQFTLWEEPTS